ncbi:hypothetical protein ACVWYI_006644 [Bradyrhizobium sp. LB13.1]
MENLSQPFGMALVGDTFYVGNTDGVMAFPYVANADRITAPGKRLTTFKPNGHWTRSLLASPDGKKLYAGVGSLSNIAEMGMEVEQGRAAVYELDLVAGTHRIFGAGLRNPVGLAWEPTTNVLWTVVNERDGLGDETPPDYLTSVRDGGFYGWPYCYWGKTVDDRVPAGSDAGRQGAHAGLCARRTHRFARPVLDAGGYTARLPGRHGDRPARLVESQQAVRLQTGVHPVRERKALRSRSRHPVGLPGPGREGILRPPGWRRDWPRQEVAADGRRRRQRDLARDGRVKVTFRRRAWRAACGAARSPTVP